MKNRVRRPCDCHTRFGRINKLYYSTGAFALIGDQVEDLVEAENVDQEQRHNQQGIQHTVSIYQIVKNVVGCAVASHQEHIVVIQRNVGYISCDAEENQNGVGDEHITLAHPLHSGEHNVQRCKAGNAVGDAGDYIVHRKNGVGVVVLGSTDCAEYGT